MARTSDALAGVTLVVIAVVLLALWRAGTLRRLVTPTSERYSELANRGGTPPRMTAVDAIPNAGGAPQLAPASTPSRAAGVPSNGFTPTGPVSGSTPVYFPPMVAGVAKATKAAEDLTYSVTQLPEGYELRAGGRIVLGPGISPYGASPPFAPGRGQYVVAGGTGLSTMGGGGEALLTP